MNITVKAVVLHVQKVSESDRICTLLTDSRGIMRIYARGASNIKNKNFNATQQFACGTYTTFYGKDLFKLDESTCDEVFMPLRSDINKLALAQYICELSNEMASEGPNCREYLHLVKNAFYLLANDARPPKLIKAAAEMRLLALSGYMPDLIMCSGCGVYEADLMYFDPAQGIIRCSDCNPTHGSVAMSRGALSALRHVIYVDVPRIYAFALPEPSLSMFANAAERFLLNTVGHSYKTLDFFHSVENTYSESGSEQ